MLGHAVWGLFAGCARVRVVSSVACLSVCVCVPVRLCMCLWVRVLVWARARLCALVFFMRAVYVVILEDDPFTKSLENVAF